MKQRHWVIDALIALVCGGGIVVWLGYFRAQHLPATPGEMPSRPAQVEASALPSVSAPPLATATPDPTLYLVALGGADIDSFKSAEHVARALEDATPNLPEDMHIRVFTNARRTTYRYSLSDPLPKDKAEKILQRAHDVGWKDEVFLTRAEGWRRAK